MKKLPKGGHLGTSKGKEFRPLPRPSGWKIRLLSLLLFGLVFCVFLPATRNEFTNYDDTEYVTENSHVQGGPTREDLTWALTNSHVNWHPLTWMSHMADCRLYGLKPAGHHLTSVLLHALNTMLLFLALQRMTGATGRSLVVAALFGLHPLRVESVAWVAERKDVLSGFFFMLLLLAYAEYSRRTKVQAPKTRLCYTLALTAFVLGLMSKPMLVTAPFVLLLLDWWPLNRVSTLNPQVEEEAMSDQGFEGRRGGGSSKKGAGSGSQLAASGQPPATTNPGTSTFAKLVGEKVPFFLLAAALSLVTFEAQQHSGAVFKTLTWAARAENGLVSYCRYLGKMFWPADLAVYYPHAIGWPAGIVLACGVGLVAVSVLAVSLSRRHPYLLVGWLWYVGTLVPVIGLMQVGSQSMADRYTYIPMIGILVMIVWGINDLAGRRRNWRAALSAVGAAATVVCAVLTHRQIGWWKDSETLFRQAIAVTKENTIALDNLGAALGKKGRLDEAIEQYREALRLDASDPLAHNGLGAVLTQKRDYGSAAEHLAEALRINPDDGLAHGNLGVILAHRGLLEEAIGHFEMAVKLRPDNAEFQNDLGSVLMMKNRYGDAIPHCRAAVHLKPDDASAHRSLGLALAATGGLDEAIEQFGEAVRLQPGIPEVQNDLGSALAMKRLFDDAIPHYRDAIRLKPDYPNARKNLGVALVAMRQYDEAIEQFREAIRLQPDFPAALENLRAALELKMPPSPPAGSTSNSP